MYADYGDFEWIERCSNSIQSGCNDVGKKAFCYLDATYLSCLCNNSSNKFFFNEMTSLQEATPYTYHIVVIDNIKYHPWNFSTQLKKGDASRTWQSWKTSFVTMSVRPQWKAIMLPNSRERLGRARLGWQESNCFTRNHIIRSRTWLNVVEEPSKRWLSIWSEGAVPLLNFCDTCSRQPIPSSGLLLDDPWDGALHTNCSIDRPWTPAESVFRGLPPNGICTLF